jgi:hypothetical protein
VYYVVLIQIARVVGIPRVEVDEAATRLQDEGVTEIGVPIDGLPGTWLVWRDQIIPDLSTCLAP